MQKQTKQYTIKELGQAIEKGTSLEVLAKGLDIKEYVPIQELKAEIERLVNETIIKQGRLYTYNSIDKFVTLVNGFMYLYINNLYHSENDKYEDYDAMVKTGILDYVVQNMLSKQYDEFCTFFDLVMSETIQMNNDIEMVISKIINEIGDKGISLLSQADDFIEMIKGVVQDCDQDTIVSLLTSIAGVIKQ